MCPARYCKADNPVQALIDVQKAETLGHAELAGAVHCTECGTAWLKTGEHKRILGRFAGPINALGWMPISGSEVLPEA